MKKEKLKRRYIYVSEKQWESIRKIAYKKEVTMSAIIRQAVELMYSKEGI